MKLINFGNVMIKYYVMIKLRIIHGVLEGNFAIFEMQYALPLSINVNQKLVI